MFKVSCFRFHSATGMKCPDLGVEALPCSIKAAAGTQGTEEVDTWPPSKDWHTPCVCLKPSWGRSRNLVPGDVEVLRKGPQRSAIFQEVWSERGRT